MNYELREHPLLPEAWEVSLIENKEISLILFAGKEANKKALEYIEWQKGKNEY